MELTAKRPFLLGNRVVLEGERFETTDTHGKELMVRGTATQESAEKAQSAPSGVVAPSEMRAGNDIAAIVHALGDMITPTPIADVLDRGATNPAEEKPSAPRTKKSADTKKGV